MQWLSNIFNSDTVRRMVRWFVQEFVDFAMGFARDRITEQLESNKRGRLAIAAA